MLSSNHSYFFRGFSRRGSDRTAQVREMGQPGRRELGCGLRILCAEDNAMVGDVLIRLLTFAGHAPELAADGHAAWKRLEHDPAAFDLLITDHQMPGLDGIELVRRLRTIRFPGKIMVYSSTLGSAEVDAYQALSVDLIVQKSVAGEVLLGAVESICGRH